MFNKLYPNKIGRELLLNFISCLLSSVKLIMLYRQWKLYWYLYTVYVCALNRWISVNRANADFRDEEGGRSPVKGGKNRVKVPKKLLYPVILDHIFTNFCRKKKDFSPVSMNYFTEFCSFFYTTQTFLLIILICWLISQNIHNFQQLLFRDNSKLFNSY